MQHKISIRILKDNAEGQFREKKMSRLGKRLIYYQRLRTTELKNES